MRRRKHARVLQAGVIAGLLLCVGGGLPAAPTLPARLPILLDTDIGGDIDDAFAVAMAARSPQLKLLAVTTVGGNAQARARLAAKLLQAAGRSDVPVAAGTPGKDGPVVQARWAEGFASTSLVQQPAVELLRDEIDRAGGGVVLVAIGPLTNVAELLRRYPEVKGKIREIALMGGSLAQGYSPGSPAIAESNIASDAAAAQTVFRSGVPLLVAPLDATSQLQLGGKQLEAFFAHRMPLTNAVRSLYELWGQSTPTLHDVLPLSLLLAPKLCETRATAMQVSAEGWTRVSAGTPNAEVALHCDPAKVIDRYLTSFTP